MNEAQRLAAGVVGSVLGGRSLDAALAHTWRRHPRLDARRRAAVQDLAYGTLRFLPRLEALLELLLRKPANDVRLRALLLVALYQLEHTQSAGHAVVDQAVRACQALGFTSAKGLTNALLRRFLRERAALHESISRAEPALYAHPQWWIDKLREQYPDRYGAILEAGNARPPMALRVNGRRIGAADYVKRLQEAGIAGRLHDGAIVLDKPVPVAALPGFRDGLVSIQDAAAQWAAPLLDAREGMRVLDACAAPGGKTSHILELADVALTALDVDPARLERVRENLGRLGLDAAVVCGDAADTASWWDGRPFDRILADVPCSASGVVRRHPDIKRLRRADDIPRFALLQSRMLDALWQTLAGGGKLLYATCSLFHEENQDQMARFLQRHRDAARLTLPAVDSGHRLPAGQLLPDTWHDGFFYALLQKL